MPGKEWKQFLVLLDQDERKKLLDEFEERIPEYWNMDMKRAVIASNTREDQVSDSEYARLYKKLGQGAQLFVTAFGMNENCACALCRMKGVRRDVLLPLAHDWGSQVWESLSITDWQPLDKPVELFGIVALQRPFGISPEDIRSKVIRRVAEWKSSLSVPVNVVLDDGGLPVDGKVRDILDRMPTKSGWFDRGEKTANVYIPNLIIHSNTEKQLSIFDVKILEQTVGRFGLTALVGKAEDVFLKKLGNVDVQEDGLEDESAMERATRYVHRVVRNLAAEFRQGDDSASYSIGPVKEWMRVREALLAANPHLPGLKGGDSPVERTDRLLVNAIASYASKVRYNDAELHDVTRDEQRAQYNAALARLVARHDQLEARGRRMTGRELEKGIRLGHPSNILLCATSCLRDTDTIIQGKAIYGKEDSQDKQIRHPYDVMESLSDLPDNLADPLAVYYHRDDSSSATVILDKGVEDADGHCTFVAALCHANDKDVNIVKTVFPKWDLDIILNLARSRENGRPLVSYVRPDFEEKWLRPACERIRTYYEETLPAIYEGEEKDATYLREMEKYEIFKKNLPLAEKMIGYLARVNVPDDDKRFFRVQGASAEPSGDLVGSLDTPIALAATESHRTALTEYKRSVVEQYVAGMATTPFSVCTAESLPVLMKRDGVPDDDIVSVSEALDEGLEINGFVHGGKVYVISDNMHSLEQVRNTYVHERQHILDATVEKKQMDALVGEIDADRAWRLLSCLTRDRDAYDGRSGRELLSEASAFAMELAYCCEPAEVEDMLRSKGVEDKDFIRFIKDKNNGQYKEDALCKARYTSSFCDSYRIRSFGVQQKTLRTAVEGQGTGPAEGYKEGVEVTPLERLSAAQKRDGVRYPTWRELEAAAPSAAVLSAPRRDMSLSLRINRKTKPIVSKWFDKWFKASYGKNFFPIDGVEIEAPAPELVEDAEGGFAEDLNNQAKEDAWKKTRNAYREQFLAYIDTLEGNNLQLAASKWFCTGAVRLPEDIDKVKQALHVAEVNKVDFNTYNSPMDIILRFAKKEDTEYVSPYDYSELTDEVILDNGLHYFTIKDDFEGQMAMRMILNGQPNTCFHKAPFSPWCLLTATEGNRVPTESAKNFWANRYNGMPKGIWMKEMMGSDGNIALDKDGRPKLAAYAFHADTPSMKDRETNWSLDDSPFYDGKVPVVTYDGNSNKTITVYSAKNGHIISEDSVRVLSEPGLKEFIKEYLGGRADGYLRDDVPEDEISLNVKTAYDAEGRVRAVQVGDANGKKAVAASYRYDGQGRRTLWTEQTLTNGVKNGPYRSFWPNGNPKLVCTYINHTEHPYAGDYVQYFEDGSVYKKGKYTSKGFPVGEHIENYPGGAPKKRFTYNDNAELIHAVTYGPDGLMMSETKDDVLTVYYPEKNPRTGAQLPAKVCHDPRFVNISKKFKGIVARSLKTEYHPFTDADGNPVVKRRTHYRDYIPYLQETFDREGHVTAREWKSGRYSPYGNNRFLLTDDTMKQAVVELNRFDYGNTHSMRVVYNDDWSIREVTTRKHSEGMKPDGFHCLFPGDGTAVISRYHDGVYDAASEKKVSVKEGMAACTDNRFFRLCEFVRTAAPEKITGLFQRIVDNKSDRQTTEDILIDELVKEYNEKKKEPRQENDDLPLRIEGRDGTKEKNAVSFDSLIKWFIGLGEERQLEVFGAVGLELPNRYGMGSFPEVFCNAMTDSPSVVITPQQLATVYSLYDRDMETVPDDIDSSLAGNRALSLNVETKEAGKEERKESGRLMLGDVRKLGTRMLDSMRSVVACAERKPVALPFLMFRADGSMLTADNAIGAAAAGAGKNWAPDFFTRKELQALGADVVRPDVRPVTVKTPAGEDGTVTTETLYNLADSTFPQQHPQEYAVYLKVREEQRNDMRGWLDACMPDPEEFKDDLCDAVLKERPAFRQHAACLRNIVEVGVNSLSGQPMGMPFTVEAWPDEQTAYHMTRAVGRAIENVVGEYLPQENAPAFVRIIGRIREAAREKNMAWAKDYGNGTGTGKGIH